MEHRGQAAIAVSAVIGGLIGAALVAPIGTKTYDGPSSCDSCNRSVHTLLIGAHISGEYPVWILIASVVLCAAVVGGITALVIRD
jgi:NADH:ubiquinone oxidoreductase subunit 6 (subunit J)